MSPPTVAMMIRPSRGTQSGRDCRVAGARIPWSRALTSSAVRWPFRCRYWSAA